MLSQNLPKSLGNEKRVVGEALLIRNVRAACSLVKPAEPATDKQSQAQRLAAEGKHAEAAREYAQLAAQTPAEHDNFELLSAEQWVIAGNLPAAKEALAAAPDARTTLPTSRALVAAEIALAENDGARAIRELDAISVPTQAELAQNYWRLRGEAAFLTSHPVEGTRAFVERERYLTDPATLRESRAELFDLIKHAAESGASLKAPPKTDPIVAGWLALGPIAVDMTRDPTHAATELENWRRTYPQHPANDSVSALANG